jgi:hypothetical protein
VAAFRKSKNQAIKRNGPQKGAVEGA